MAVKDEFLNLATNNVDILSVINFIENDLNIDFNIQEGVTYNLRCPHEVLDGDSNVHESSSVTKTSINMTTNTIKCWNPACGANRPINTIGLIRLFYEDLSFERAVEKVLSIGGIEYESEKREISEETRLALLLTNYVNECSNNLVKGYEILEEKKEPKGRFEILYTDAAKYLISRGIPKFVARKMKLGIGGGYSNILKSTPTHILVKAKILSSKKKFEIMSKRILIPNISKGLVLGITGRDVYDGKLRYLNVGLVKNLINIDKAKKYKTIYLFEGALNGASYMALTGNENFMAMQGAESFKKEFLQEIITEKMAFDSETEFIYVSDCDIAGLKAATDLGIDILRLGFSINILVTPATKSGKKIDINDILVKYGKEQALTIWTEFIKREEPFIVFAIKQEIARLEKRNTLTYELQKCKIIKKYLSLSFIDPNERWVLEQYFLHHGYPVTSEFFDYLDVNFTTEPVLSGDKLICFVGDVNSDLKENLLESKKPCNVLNLEVRSSIYNIDKSVPVTLITNSMYLFRTKKIAEKLLSNGNSVSVFHTDTAIKSLMEYMFAVSKAVPYTQFINNFGR